MTFLSGISGISGLSKSPYIANLVLFDGTNDILLRNADYTSNADSKVGICSIWVDLKSGDGALKTVFGHARFVLLKLTDNKYGVNGYNSSGTLVYQILSSSAYTSSSGLHHILIAWDLATSTAQLYINDVDVLSPTTTLTNDNIDHTRSQHAIGGHVTTPNVHANLAEFYLNTSSYIDISVEANRRKFITADMTAEFLGSDGSLPTGSQPIAYHSGLAASWHINKGYGGGMTETGEITDGGTF